MNILVTGGTGTIGRMVCKKLVEKGNEVVVLSRDPAKQLINCPNMKHEVGRIEDEHFVQHVFRKHEIHGVVHTAANKHIGVCEDRPTEAIGANVIGSLNILKAIEENAGRRAVFVSSDKACNHDHVYGITKYLMEKLVSEYAQRLSHTRLNCVRFGNIFGSSGSVLPIWKSKISRGHDIELRVFTRYQSPPWRLAMLPSQAADFCIKVLEAGEFESGSVVFQGGIKEISLKTVAEYMTSGTSSKIHEIPSMPMEALDEWMCTMKEADHLKEHDGQVYEIRRLPTGCARYVHSNMPMDDEEASVFLEKALKEMNQWT
jgi:UDP-N-acetylglucosamine 4,6-dehydratase